MSKPSSINRSRIGLNVILQVALLFLIGVMVNYFAFNHYDRWDFSRDSKYSLSDQTKRVVGDLKKPVDLIVFFAGNSPVANDVAALAKEYAGASKKKVRVEVVNPYLNLTRARELASEYKLGDQENVVVISYDGRSKMVNAADMAEFEPSFNPLEKPRLKAFKGEEALTGALLEVTEHGINKIYAIGGHGETAFDSDDLSGLKTYIERQNIAVAPLKLADVDAIPTDARMLFIIGPKYDFSERDLGLLATYWNKQGRIFVLLDPASSTPNLAGFLHRYGVAVNNDRVLKTVPLGDMTGVLREITGDFVPGTPITKRLQNVNAAFMGVTQSLTLLADRVKEENIRLAPLIRASKGYWAEPGYDISGGGGIFFNANEDTPTPFVAAAVEKGALNDERVEVESSRMVVVGNSAFISNQALTTADLDFVLSSVNWLLNRNALIGIAPKAVRNFSLSLSDSQMSSLALITMGGIPGGAALLGLIAWFKRRR
jgi:ABC-type uncharacterized transport system involved in gliding motility auxiliary subunit